MKEKLIALVVERANISQDAATKAVDAIFGFLKENPGQISEMLGQSAHSGPLAGVGKLFGR